jgi:hypothetical protein
MTSGYKPEWDIDKSYGEEGERRFAELFGWLATGDPRVEVKRKRRTDDWFYIELQHNPHGRGWRNSGLHTTQAEIWAFVIADTGVMVAFPTALLRAALRYGIGKPAAETDGDCPTEGRLLRLPNLMTVFAWSQPP